MAGDKASIRKTKSPQELSLNRAARKIVRELDVVKTIPAEASQPETKARLKIALDLNAEEPAAAKVLLKTVLDLNAVRTTEASPPDLPVRLKIV